MRHFSLQKHHLKNNVVVTSSKKQTTINKTHSSSLWLFSNDPAANSSSFGQPLKSAKTQGRAPGLQSFSFVPTLPVAAPHRSAGHPISWLSAARGSSSPGSAHLRVGGLPKTKQHQVCSDWQQNAAAEEEGLLRLHQVLGMDTCLQGEMTQDLQQQKQGMQAEGLINFSPPLKMIS